MSPVSRARLLAWSTAALVLVAAAVILAGSAMEVSRARQAVATPMSVAQLKADGDRRLAAGDVLGALQAYDDALMLDDTDLGTYYREGVALSHLGDREQAATMFLRVVRGGKADEEEARRARAWLDAAGIER
jgi:Flp pilus assembly protein TadD